jgi:PEP-CTERM motif-containing protein
MFWLHSDGGTPNDFTLFWNGIDLGPDLLNVGAFGYTKYTFNVTGFSGANSNLLEFVFRQDPAYWYLDDVSVVKTGTPEPASLLLFGSGILGLAGVIRRKLGA